MRPALATLALAACTTGSDTRWTAEQAWDWYDQAPIGVNYLPRTASNPLEMWAEDTFDPDTIDQELGWAEDLGVDALRVFLHDLAWAEDPDGFLDRVDAVLDLADRHGQRVLLVLFDGVWDPFPIAGPQRAPTPGVHNPTWSQSPGAAILADDAAQDALAPYVSDVVGRLRKDPRVYGWDVFNEADNPNIGSYNDVDLPLAEKSERALALLRRAIGWARAERPTQPLIAGVYSPLRTWDLDDGAAPIVEALLTETDLVSFHSYGSPDEVAAQLDLLATHGRPILCTEYMGRPVSTFAEVLPLLHGRNVGAFSWGLVDGRSQTKFPWTSWLSPVEGEPDPWFHEVLHADGTPYDAAEADLIRDIAAP